MDKNFHSGMSLAIKSRHKSINHASSRELAGPRRCSRKENFFLVLLLILLTIPMSEILNHR